MIRMRDSSSGESLGKDEGKKEGGRTWKRGRGKGASKQHDEIAVLLPVSDGAVCMLIMRAGAPSGDEERVSRAHYSPEQSTA